MKPWLLQGGDHLVSKIAGKHLVSAKSTPHPQKERESCVTNQDVQRQMLKLMVIEVIITTYLISPKNVRILKDK